MTGPLVAPGRVQSSALLLTVRLLRERNGCRKGFLGRRSQEVFSGQMNKKIGSFPPFQVACVTAKGQLLLTEPDPFRLGIQLDEKVV